MKLLDVNEYSVTKLANRIMLLKHLVLETAGKWPFMCYLFYVSIIEMFILIHFLHCKQYFSEKTTSSQIIEVV